MSLLNNHPKLEGFLDRNLGALLHLREHLRIRAFLLRLKPFVEHPLDETWAFIKGFGAWIWHGICLSAGYIRDGAVTHRVRLIWAAVAMFFIFTLVVGTYCGFAIYVERQVTPVPAPDKTVYLGQGWGDGPTSDDRDSFYFTPQGALIKNIRYEWLSSVERPWKTDRFASPDYMRGYGFIVDAADSAKNPGGFPVGIAPRYSTKHGEMVLDLTCAGCHTGELQTTVNGVRTAVRIDGGSAHVDLTTNKFGRFAGDLGVSLLNTTINPLKFLRFSSRVLKGENTAWNSLRLWGSLFGTIYDNFKLILRERSFYPMEEGYGRLDGLGRIGNATFAVNLDPKNYRVANAPVSFPVIWEMTLLDWVQYTASVKQPMARNIGESMGTGAKYYLQNEFGQPLPAVERFLSSTQVANMDKLEHLMRRLKPPCWPEDVFGKIDVEKAKKGRDLFYGKFDCVGCHGPHNAPDFVTASDAPYKLAVDNPAAMPGEKDVPHWTVDALSVQDIGTDPTSALNFLQYRVDLSKTGMTADEVRTELGPYYRTQYARDIEYYQNLVTLLNNKEDMVPPPPMPIYSIGSFALDVANKAFQVARGAYAWQLCKGENTKMPVFPLTGSRPVTLRPLTEDQLKYFWPAPTVKSSCDQLVHLVEEGQEGYMKEKLGGVQLTSVDQGTGLNYLITLVRNRAYEDMGIENQGREVERNLADGYAQLDLPRVIAQYMARPLAGMWATAPFLHNGSVPSLYEMLLPAYQRTKKFYVKGAQFDPRVVGLYTEPSEKGAYLFDTSVKGNYNTGHEFRAGYRTWKRGDPVQYGVIGPEMNDEERWAIIEYLKIRRDWEDPDETTCPETKYLPAYVPPGTQSATASVVAKAAGGAK